jgi:hypothetical protein
MAFMVPQYTREAFLVGENSHGEGDAAPFSTYCRLRDNDCAYAAKHDTDVQDKVKAAFAADRGLVESTVGIVLGRWWCRLSAPGYMDCTEWSGPYASERLAREAIADMYDCDPDTGECTDE